MLMSQRSAVLQASRSRSVLTLRFGRMLLLGLVSALTSGLTPTSAGASTMPRSTLEAASAATASAAPAMSPPWTPDGSGNGFYDENDYTDNTSSEWGIDVPLKAGTAIRAPLDGTIIAYQQVSFNDPCGIAWCPGRLLVKLSNGAVVGFGHVNPLGGIHANVAVTAGQEIATIACNHPGCPAPTDPSDGDHVEFMYDASGSGYDTRSNFIPASPVTRLNGCPHHGSFANGGVGVDP
jgi:murein DD-endopeptidase MepM/ murein hydrolase activator NlpD